MARQAQSQRRLARKYALLIIALVSGVLLVGGIAESYFSYQENKSSLARLQREQALAAAARIEQFVREIAAQIGWTTHPRTEPTETALEGRRLEFLRLLRQLPAITELSYLNGDGREQLRISRLEVDVIGDGRDLSASPDFVSARTDGTYFGPVYFRKGSEPYLSIAMASTGRDRGVIVAQANLKFILDVVRRIRVGQAGHAYVVDGAGNLIAHPDVSLVLQKSNLLTLPHVDAALAVSANNARDSTSIAHGMNGGQVLTSHAAVLKPEWFVFVEQPLGEALAPLYASIARTVAIMLLGLLLAVLVSLALAHRMVVPIRRLEAGATRIGDGALDHRISVETDDELGNLGRAFNDMAARLQDSYANLERKVEERTRALARSVEEQRALVEVGRAVSSSLDLQEVLDTVVGRAVELSESQAGTIWEFDDSSADFELRAALGLDRIIARLARPTLRLGPGSLVARAAEIRAPVQLPDLAKSASHTSPLRDALIESGIRATIAIPLLREDNVIGGLTVGKRSAGEYPEPLVDLLQAFATQSAIAVENARLFREIQKKGRELEIASEHKSQFLANMSHELRTPLNAILGYTELISDQIYGPVPEKIAEILQRVDSNGRHLLGLINAVLDLSKIEAGRLTLALAQYSMAGVVANVADSVQSLAAEKGLELDVEVPANLPQGRGDEQRITQVVLNLVGNAIKFTDQGRVGIRVAAPDNSFLVQVSDTGPGISEADQLSIFDEFRQVDSSITRQQGGTGLGLAIGRRIVELHGGEIGVESSMGRGSVFWFRLPVRVERQQEAA